MRSAVILGLLQIADHTVQRRHHRREHLPQRFLRLSVEVFDPETFEPTADIELPKDARFLIGTYQWMNALTPDKKKLLFYQFSPAPAVGIVDLEGKTFDRMVDVPDCYHIFPASPTVFYMNCRDGSLARVDIAETEPKITNTEVFHAEDEHQQYLHKVPNGYCPHHSTGVACGI